MSLWIRPASLFPRFVEEALRDFRQMERTINNDSKFAVSIDVSKFKPENLKVNLDGRNLTIEGKQEIKEENGYTMRSFVRQWVLPENVDLDAIKSSLTDSGRLSIEAPKFAKPEAETGRSIPIERVSEKQ
ncbi:Hsp20/alpha crystallin family protein [Ancylostoma ceylanicum]|uniref:Hsp20/alpha crystallin family protein n=1 Tax=Ancylostoma ceylanicum TaxID=53326 RepID=A0A0D6MC29_9BILA|nr:Hsp20/alpha crystallin family protein [Ancylostoma ceylanicum]